MQRTALESLPRTTDIFSERTGPGDAVARGFYPPLPLAADREDLPDALRTLLWGWGVLARLAAAGISEVRLSGFGGSAREAVLLMLALEDRAGGYSLEEQRRLLELCDACGVEPDGPVDVLLTGGPPFAPVARRYAALPPVLREMVNAGELELKSAERLSAYPGAAAALRRVTAGLSFSNRRRFATMLWEIAQRDELSDAQTAELAREAGAAGGSGEETPGGAVDALRRRRYPTLTSLEERFGRITDRALGGTGVELTPPANFEGGRFTVSFSFASAQELDARRRALSRLEDELDELFQLL
jgi:hypothetical protein